MVGHSPLQRPLLQVALVRGSTSRCLAMSESNEMHCFCVDRVSAIFRQTPRVCACNSPRLLKARCVGSSVQCERCHRLSSPFSLSDLDSVGEPPSYLAGSTRNLTVSRKLVREEERTRIQRQGNNTTRVKRKSQETQTHFKMSHTAYDLHVATLYRWCVVCVILHNTHSNL